MCIRDSNKVKDSDVESRVPKSMAESYIHNWKTLPQELQGIYCTYLVSGGLSLPCSVINAIQCSQGWAVLRRQDAAGTILNTALIHGMAPALEMQPQEASCPEGM